MLVTQTGSRGELCVCRTDNCWVLLPNPATGLSFSWHICVLYSKYVCQIRLNHHAFLKIITLAVSWRKRYTNKALSGWFSPVTRKKCCHYMFLQTTSMLHVAVFPFGGNLWFRKMKPMRKCLTKSVCMKVNVITTILLTWFMSSVNWQLKMFMVSVSQSL